MGVQPRVEDRDRIIETVRVADGDERLTAGDCPGTGERIERGDDPELASEVDRAEEHHAEVVAGEGARIAGSLGLDAEPHAIPDQADVAQVIVDVADERDAAAVVIGSHGTSGLRSRLLGGTSRRVLAHCTRPVVVVRSPQTGE